MENNKNPTLSQNIKFPPVPQEDEVNGSNDNCYMPAIGHPTNQERQKFIDSIKPFIYKISKEKNLPGKTILAMAILESGYGFTRIGYYANNLFGLKKFTSDSVNAYVLVGQPAEGDIQNIKIVRTTANGGLIFDEVIRDNNRYEKFATREACILFLVDTVFLKKRYKPSLDNYRKNIEDNMPENEASLAFAYEIAAAGYNHLGGKYYREAIAKVTKEKGL